MYLTPIALPDLENLLFYLTIAVRYNAIKFLYWPWQLYNSNTFSIV